MSEVTETTTPELSFVEEKVSSESDIDELADENIEDTYSKSEDVDEDDEDDETSSDEEVESEMFRKLEKEAYADILLNHHPGIKQNNYNDILAMCKIVRDAKGIITDGLHKTIPWLTKYERARVLGLRTKQLNNGADAFIEIPPGMINGDKIALEELNQKKVPFIVRRPIPNGGTEYWRLEDLELLNSY
jgi:DNA-directed RNA polymerase I, II, and III subunit RPABC2